MAAAAPDGLELEIAAVVDQLGLTEARASQACYLVDRVPDTQGLFNAYERFDGIPDLVDRLNSRLSAVCGRTRGLIDGINGFRIDRHGIFQTDLLWPGPGVSQLGTDCRVLGSD